MNSSAEVDLVISERSDGSTARSTKRAQPMVCRSALARSPAVPEGALHFGAQDARLDWFAQDGPGALGQGHAMDGVGRIAREEDARDLQRLAADRREDLEPG